MRALLILILSSVCGMAAVPFLKDPVAFARLAVASSLPPCNFDKCEDFEGTGYEHAGLWTENLTIVDEDYVDNVAIGVQALLLDPGSSCSTYFAIGPYSDEVFAHFQVRMEDSGGASWCAFRNGSTAMGLVNFHLGTMKLYVDHGGVASGFTTTVLAEDTWYHIWLRWKKSTGASDGIMQLWINTTSTKPGSPEINLTTGNGASDIDRWYFQTESPSRVVFDDLQIDNIAIP